MQQLKQWIKHGNTPLARNAWRLALALRHAQMPLIPGLHHALYLSYSAARQALSNLARCLWWTPLMQSRLIAPAPRLYLYGGLPAILGPLQLRIGADCRVAGRTTLSGRGVEGQPAVLEVGRNCDIGWGSSIAVGRRVVLGDNVRLAPNCFLAGYPGHPMNAAERAAGLPEHPEQIGDIVLAADVWLGTGVMVMAGVHIGTGTVVAAGSVVTRDLPAGVLAGGSPARVLRHLSENDLGSGVLA
ncbi:MAG: acyltransferase [Pseudomonas sp.]|jgi:acetyltransferase-like isoleucine patch superfamily enzyme|uniref:acyltransferase n=1 Tax=Pseudomonas sp. TaxID=306 RepID=UPI003982A91E